MNQEQLYQWAAEISAKLGIGKRQGKRLAVFSAGVVGSEESRMSKIGERLGGLLGVRMDSVERRLQRTLNDKQLSQRAVQQAWARWVLSSLDSDEVVLLVDETKLGGHLNVMMVGVAYAQRCIPLSWVCYDAKTPGQVKRIGRLLRQVNAALPAPRHVIVEADQGIGTSPALVRVVRRLGWTYLFRVQGTTKLITRDGREHALGEQASLWSAYGILFKQRGHLRGYALVYQEFGQDQPWCLITNDPALSVHDYALRNWQEQSFRDLKRGGWNWQQSRVWQPDHAHILLLVLALSYAWLLSLGTLVAHAELATRLRISRGKRRCFSIFRQGLRYWLDLFFTAKSVRLVLFFAPGKLLT